MTTTASERRSQQAEIALGITSRYEEVLFSLVDFNPDQPRQDIDGAEITKLAQSIQANSLLQVPTIRRHPETPGRYLVVAGERRLRAMIELGETKSTFKVIEGKGVAKSYILSVIENLHRVNLNPIEEALSYQRLHDEEDLSWEMVSKITGRDLTFILTKIKLLTLPDKIQQMVRRGELPQVTALNLHQWRNNDGEYLRMAHDLIAGREPAAIHFRQETLRGQRQVQARLPQNPEEFAKRIVKLAGYVQSMPAVLEAFLKLSPTEQTAVLNNIHPSVVGKLRVRFVALYRASQAMSEKMNTYDTARIGRGPSLEEVAQITEPPSPPPTPAPAQKPAANKPLAAVPKSSTPPRTAAKKAVPVFEGGDDNYVQWFQAISQLFYSSGIRRVDLSLVKLRNNLGLADIEVRETVVRAIDAARANWRVAPQGSETKQKFIRLVARLRHDYGNMDNFDNFLAEVRRTDQSKDPVRL